MNSGISGIVFNTKGVMWANEADKESNFVGQVDN